ncbi:hypothetical protein RHSIM_RhsimUnG0090300 [Rhododendron simsii]|uniref:Transmembrane protein n=1 Tax=Rhododendron simsii TaxID=118357 RepID=A0A834FVB7_RHOSS|nr:hypothetical protein RHSIM_RhsimUnG0090300 [Rhododendron simsii]
MLVLSRKHLESILVTSFTLAAFLFALPREYKEDKGGGGTSSPVPTVVFNTLPPSTFHVFVLSLIFALAFSLSALLIHDSSSDHNTTSTAANNKISGYYHQHLVNFCGSSSLASIAKALAILFQALLLTSFTFAAFLFALPREYKEDGEGGGTKSPVSTVVFNTLPPSTFHVFILSLIFALSFSLSTLLIHDSSSDHNTTSTAANNKISGYYHQHLVNFFGSSSFASIATVLAILFRALILTAIEAYYSSSPSSAPTIVLCRSCSNAGAVFIGSGDCAVQPPARPCWHRSDNRRRSLATTMIAFVILMAAVISTANAGCTLPQGTNGSHEVLIPGHQSSIPSDVLATPPSVTADRAPLDVVDSGGQDDDSYGGGNYQATAAGIRRNDYIAEFPPHHVDVPAVTGEISSIDQIRTEERVEDHDENDSFKFGNTMALMVSSFQPRGNLSVLVTWSPSRSTSSPPPTSSLSSSASFQVTMARLAVAFGFTVNLIALMMLRGGHRTAANFFRHAGFFSVAVAFFSMTYMFVPNHLAWAVLAAAGVLALVFFYSILLRN